MMMTPRTLLALVPVVLVVACNRDRSVDRTGTTGAYEKPGETTITGAHVNTTANQVAIDRIVAARCAREQACNNVGPDKSFASSQACDTKIRADMREDLKVSECPYGVDEKELRECLDSIHKEDCGNPIDTISRLAACRTSDMCLKNSPANR